MKNLALLALSFSLVGSMALAGNVVFADGVDDSTIDDIKHSNVADDNNTYDYSQDNDVKTKTEDNDVTDSYNSKSKSEDNDVKNSYNQDNDVKTITKTKSEDNDIKDSFNLHSEDNDTKIKESYNQDNDVKTITKTKSEDNDIKDSFNLHSEDNDTKIKESYNTKIKDSYNDNSSRVKDSYNDTDSYNTTQDGVINADDNSKVKFDNFANDNSTIWDGDVEIGGYGGGFGYEGKGWGGGADNYVNTGIMESSVMGNDNLFFQEVGVGIGGDVKDSNVNNSQTDVTVGGNYNFNGVQP